jgi:multiple sugar transport system permease protein
VTKLKSISRHLAGILCALIFLLPLFWAVVASLRNPSLPPLVTLEWWPQDPHWDNYLEIFRLLPMLRYLRNSVIVAIIAVPITVLIASLAGFGISQLPARLQSHLVMWNVVLLMIPGTAVWLFRFQILSALGLIDTLWALIFPAFSGSSPLFVLLYYWSFRRIPKDGFDAARLEGINITLAWWQLGLPVAWPTTGGIAVLTFVIYWSDFVSPVLYIFNPQWYTLPVGLQILKQYDVTNIALLMATAVFITIPVIVLFVFLQRFFLHELSIANLLDRN